MRNRSLFGARTRVLALLSLAGLGVSCSAHQQLATQAVSFNLTVERAQNEMLLLNVLRAKNRQPMYLTSISSLSGNFQTSLTAGLNVTRSHATKGPENTITRTVMPSLSTVIARNPTFNLAVLDSNEFMRGFLSPINKETLFFFWNQGWRPEILLHLLVQEVRIEEQDSLTVIRNYPDSEDVEAKELKEFGAWVEGFLSEEPRVEARDVAENLGPTIPEDQSRDLSKLVAVAKESLAIEVAPCGGGYVLRRKKTDLQFVSASSRPNPETPICGPSSTPVDYESAARAQKIAASPELMAARSASKEVTLVLRSPEAVLYYLGQLARMENRADRPIVPEVCIRDRFQPLFAAFPQEKCPRSQVSVDTGDSVFVVPTPEPDNTGSGKCKPGEIRLITPTAAACNGGRSMQALSLLNQLIGLQKSAKDLPSTALVRLIE